MNFFSLLHVIINQTSIIITKYLSWYQILWYLTFTVQEIKHVGAFLLKLSIPVICFKEGVKTKEAFYPIHFHLFLSFGSEIIYSSRKRKNHFHDYYEQLQLKIYTLLCIWKMLHKCWVAILSLTLIINGFPAVILWKSNSILYQELGPLNRIQLIKQRNCSITSI